MQLFCKQCSWFWSANRAGPVQKSSILTEGQGWAALQHVVLLVPGHKSGQTCAKIVHFNRGSRPGSPSARGAPGSELQTGPDLFTKRPFEPRVKAVHPFITRCSWFRAANRAGPEQKRPFFNPGGQGRAALQHTVLLFWAANLAGPEQK